VAGANCGKDSAPVAGIDDRVIHDLAEEMRALQRPLAPLAIRLEEEEALAGAYENYKHRE
jgi:hypothetical protein